MAQTKKTAPSGAKKPTSTARHVSSTKKPATSAGKSGSRPTSTARKPKAAEAPAPAPQHKPIRRQAAGFVVLFLGLVAIIALFPAEGWLVELYRKLVRGFVGWGYYISFLALLWAAWILEMHHGRPITARLVCALLLPLVFGAFIHLVSFDREGLFSPGFSYGMNQLWTRAQDASEHCGGVFAGMTAIFLRSSIGVIGGVIVLVAAFFLMLIKAADQSVLELWAALKNRPAYEPEPDPYAPSEEDIIAPEDRIFPVGRAEAPPRPAALPKKEEKAPKKSRRPRMYDEDWENAKDRLFAEMDIDPEAQLRVAAALAEERTAKTKPAPAPAPVPVEKKEEKPAKPPKTKDKPAVSDTKDVEPLSVEEAADIAGIQLNSADMDTVSAVPVVEKVKIDKDAEAALVAKEIEEQQEEDKPAYIFPEIGLLNKSKPVTENDGEELDEVQQQLQSAIRSFGVGATITGAVRGPSITRYELLLDQGVKLNKITNLSNDIALSLGVSNVRIAPIPDKISTVGVEVPNRSVRTVWLGDVIDSDAFRSAKSKLSFSVGKDIAGNVIIGNIAKMPHVLIAGTTGSGKSVCINSLILSLLYKSTPDEVKLIMVDPKMVELGIYNGMPHLYVPVVTDPKKAAGALQWSVVEMLKRYRLFSEVGVRDLAGYNQTLRANDQPILPQVVIIIDELADLMMVASKEVEESICRVAQMGRAAGMHLVVATQRPSSDVITGLMKANIPSRIAFAVSSALESRIILDQQGAEKLVGAGDMLYSPIGQGKPLRVQGAFVTDEEREEIIEFIKKESEAQYSDEIIAEIEKAAVDTKGGKSEEAEESDTPNDYDELLPQAVEVIFETKQASVSMLQRRLKLGYSRAARLIDQLEEVGVVGPFEGSKPRQILLTKQQWQEMQYSHGTAPVDTIASEFGDLTDREEFTEEEDDVPPMEEEDPEDEDIPWDEE